jgi:tetratricopeptide (TPR) repeat protein
MSSSKLGDVKVVVKKDGATHDSFTTRANGKYEFYLDCGHEYDFIFQKEGYVERSIQINSKGVPPEIIGAGIIMPTDMSMYEITPAMEGSDLSVFDKPIGKASYDPSQADLVWDFAYTNQVKGEIFKFIRDAEKKAKELEKEASAEEKAAAELEKKFNDFVKKGDDAMSSDDFEDAVINYQAALDLKPGDGAVEAKLGNAQTKWNQLKANQKIEEDFSAALDAGDSFMRTQEYEKAIEQYQEALKIKPGESYPEEQITEANKILEEIAANKAKQEEFNELMAEADAKVGEEKYEEGIAKYEEALTVIPGNKEAENKLENAREALASIEEKAARQAEFDGLIASADQAFQAEKFEEAKGLYEQASNIFPDESYPKEQITLCESKLQALADAAEKQEAFDKLVEEGNESLTTTDYEDAVGKFTEALELIPNQEPAVSKLAEAQSLLTELKENQAKKENYDALISEADDAFGNEEYDLAKTKYQAAKNIFPEENYPTDQLTKISALLAELADQRATQEAYDKAMASGASAMEAEQYESAVGYFRDALVAIPDDKEATKQLDEANAALTALQESMAQKEQYDALIASADKKFEASSWNEAITDYEGALAILSDEVYPQERIKAAQANIEKEKAAAEQAETQAAFDALVAEGDQLVDSDQFDSAIAKYEEALDLLESKEVESKIESAKSAKEALLAEKNMQERYDAAIAEADDSFQKAEWEQAITGYTKAQDIKPDESYPAEQIKLANEEIAALQAAAEAELEEAFNQLVSQGDKQVDDNAFDLGIAKYKEALELKESPEVEEKIASAERQKEEYKKQQSIDEQYQDALATADALFAEEALIEAKASYEVASEIKPSEQYPKDRIAAIDETLAAKAEAEQAALRAEFDGLVAKGDKALEDKAFTDAIASYESALALMESAEVSEKISAAKSARSEFEDAQAKRTRYEQLIAEADVDFSQENWSAASSAYKEASEVLPEENYPKDQLNRIQEEIEAADEAAAAAAQAEREARFSVLVKEGDELVAATDYGTAIDKYEEALNILPEREDVKEKLSNAESAMLAQQESEALQQAYLDAIDQANSEFDRENWESALSSYKEALEIKPSETYPKERIEEVELKLEALAEADRLEREAELRKEFDELIEAGDKQFNKSKFEKALVEYEAALALMPDNEVAQQKVKVAQEALGELEADLAAVENYKSLIDEADDLFKSEDYEMSKMKYADAAEVMPNEEYPKNRIVEIDLLLEKQRLRQQALEQEELDQQYREAVQKGDDAFSSNDFDLARTAYESAIELKPEETYPKGQLERIDMKLEEEANAEEERKRLAALEEERRRAEEKRREELNRVNADSENQAEQFMKEAREAAENEKYEQIKRQKINQEEQILEYEAMSEEMRKANYLSFEAYRRKFADQYGEPISVQKKKVGNSVKYKKTLLSNSSKPQDLDKVRNGDQYAEIIELQDEIERWKREMASTESELIRAEREKSKDALADMEEKANMSYSERVTANKEYQKNTAQQYREMQERAQKRKDNAKALQMKATEYGEYISELNQKSIEQARQNKQELSEKYAEQTDKETGFRSDLAENYPQGVTEESSTLGNKVIITRIVVHGKQGDQYKKVVDKAGEYYFKNGLSISENTWNRETIDAFNRGKD